MAIPLFLVNNFGVFEPKPFFAIEDADWMRFFETNVLSGVRLSRHHSPRMRERGWERIIFISSESALNIPQEMIHYGMTKTAQLAVSRGLAIELAGSGVTVNAVLPIFPVSRESAPPIGRGRSPRLEHFRLQSEWALCT